MRFRYFLVLLFFIIGLSTSFAQCAMCRAVAESSREGGSSIANGLNTGILYLMSFPYVLLIIGILSLLYKRNN